MCTTSSFEGWGINTPSYPFSASLSDQFRDLSCFELPRTLAFIPLCLLARFSEGIEGKFVGEQDWVLVSWFPISWAPLSLSRRWISCLLLLELQAPSRLGNTCWAPNLWSATGSLYDLDIKQEPLVTSVAKVRLDSSRSKCTPWVPQRKRRFFGTELW